MAFPCKESEMDGNLEFRRGRGASSVCRSFLEIGLRTCSSGFLWSAFSVALGKVLQVDCISVVTLLATPYWRLVYPRNEGMTWKRCSRCLSLSGLHVTYEGLIHI